MCINSEIRLILRELDAYAEQVRQGRIQRVLKILNNIQDKDHSQRRVYNKLCNQLTSQLVISDQLEDTLEEAEILLELL